MISGKPVKLINHDKEWFFFIFESFCAADRITVSLFSYFSYWTAEWAKFGNPSLGLRVSK